MPWTEVRHWPSRAAREPDDAIDRSELHQAQGMVMVQLGTDLATAMVRLRAHAYGGERRLGDVARDIVARRLRLDQDTVNAPRRCIGESSPLGCRGGKGRRR